MKILITGASGLIGRSLIHRLLIEGHDVRALARSIHSLPELAEKNIFPWSDDKQPPVDAISGCDAIVHLAGEGIADQRWTAARKKRLWDSRVEGTKNLVAAIAELAAEKRPKVLISGSAIGYYSDGSHPQNESSPKGTGFLPDLSEAWEEAASKAEKLGLRTVFLRTGLVLAKHGGVLKKTGPVILGNGQQWMSWIHIEDMVRFIIYSIQTAKASGAYNLTAPNPVTNAEFTKAFAKKMNIPITIHAPSLALKFALGEMAKVILASQKVIPEKAIADGFMFKFKTIESALSDIYKDSNLVDNYFSTKQFIPLKRKDIFPFFGKAENLETLTPPWLHFHIINKSTPNVHKGTLIDYKLNIHGFPIKWRTLISDWNPEISFIDSQLRGPYKKWHHVHTFEDVPGGTLISDDITFRPPGWIFGKLLLPLVRKDLLEIFQFRQKKIKELYLKGSME